MEYPSCLLVCIVKSNYYGDLIPTQFALMCVFSTWGLLHLFHISSSGGTENLEMKRKLKLMAIQFTLCGQCGVLTELVDVLQWWLEMLMVLITMTLHFM